MKKLLTNNTGGFPFVLDDLRWIESGNQEVFKALIVPYLPYSDVQNAIIISGLKVDDVFGYLRGGEEGYVYWNGEVFYSPGIYLESPDFEFWGGRVCMRIKETFDESEAGNKVFQIGGGPVPVYVNRTVELIYVDDGDSLPPDTEWLPKVSILDAIQQSMNERAGAIVHRGVSYTISLPKKEDGSFTYYHGFGSNIFVFCSVETVSGGSKESDRNDVTIAFKKSNNSITFWLHNFESRPIDVKIHYILMK